MRSAPHALHLKQEFYLPSEIADLPQTQAVEERERYDWDIKTQARLSDRRSAGERSSPRSAIFRKFKTAANSPLVPVQGTSRTPCPAFAPRLLDTLMLAGVPERNGSCSMKLEPPWFV